MEVNSIRVWRRNDERKRYFGARGVIKGYSVVYSGPEGLENRTPYVVGLVEVEGKRVMARIVEIEPDMMRLGMSVIGRMRRLMNVTGDSVVVYGVVFGPLRERRVG